MSITTNQETADAVTRARGLYDLLDEQADASEELGKLTDDIDDALHDTGLYGMWVPKSLGGLELDPSPRWRSSRPWPTARPPPAGR